MPWINFIIQIISENITATAVLGFLLFGAYAMLSDNSQSLWEKVKMVFAVPVFFAIYAVAIYFTNTAETIDEYANTINQLRFSDEELTAYNANIERKKQNEIQLWNSLKDATEKSLTKIDLLKIDSEVQDLNEIAFGNFVEKYKGQIIETTAPMKNLEKAEWSFGAREGYQGYWIVLRHRGVTKEIPKGGIDPASLFLGESTRTIGIGLTFMFSGNCEVDQNFSDALISKKIDSNVTIRSYIGNVHKWGFESQDNWCIIIP